jgi:hypothetical protein
MREFADKLMIRQLMIRLPARGGEGRSAAGLTKRAVMSEAGCRG